MENAACELGLGRLGGGIGGVCGGVGGKVLVAGSGGDADDDRVEIEAGGEESFDSTLEIELLEQSERASYVVRTT